LQTREQLQQIVSALEDNPNLPDKLARYTRVLDIDYDTSDHPWGGIEGSENARRSTISTIQNLLSYMRRLDSVYMAQMATVDLFDAIYAASPGSDIASSLLTSLNVHLHVGDPAMLLCVDRFKNLQELSISCEELDSPVFDVQPPEAEPWSLPHLTSLDIFLRGMMGEDVTLFMGFLARCSLPALRIFDFFLEEMSPACADSVGTFLLKNRHVERVAMDTEVINDFARMDGEEDHSMEWLLKHITVRSLVLRLGEGLAPDLVAEIQPQVQELCFRIYPQQGAELFPFLRRIAGRPPAGLRTIRIKFQPTVSGEHRFWWAKPSPGEDRQVDAVFVGDLLRVALSLQTKGIFVIDEAGMSVDGKVTLPTSDKEFDSW
jgi:hypothetical protein